MSKPTEYKGLRLGLLASVPIATLIVFVGFHASHGLWVALIGAGAWLVIDCVAVGLVLRWTERRL